MGGQRRRWHEERGEAGLVRGIGPPTGGLPRERSWEGESTSRSSGGEEARPQPLQLPSRPPTHLPNCSSFNSFYTFFSSFPCSFSPADPSRHLLGRREVSRCEAPSASHQKMVSRSSLEILQFDCGTKSVNVTL